MKIRTWHYEFLVVIFSLITITYLIANNVDNWIATLAVCITFGYTQISDRLMERQKVMQTPDVDCYWKLVYYFWAKEIVWIILFLKLHSLASLGGCFIFAIYPFWRKYYRKNIKPITSTSFSVPPYVTITSVPYIEKNTAQGIGRINRLQEKIKNE